MRKYALTLAIASATILGTAFTASAAGHAKACDDETMAMVMEGLETAPAANKEMAMAEFGMAKEKMEAGMSEECSGHLTKASELSAAQ